MGMQEVGSGVDEMHDHGKAAAEGAAERTDREILAQGRKATIKTLPKFRVRLSPMQDRSEDKRDEFGQKGKGTALGTVLGVA